MDDKSIDTIWCAWSELNAIRARDGAPFGVCEKYFDGLVYDLKNMLPPQYRNPWHPKYVRSKK